MADNTIKNEDRKFKTFAYYMAWIGFIGSIALAIRDALKDSEPPEKEKYYQ